MNGRIFSVRSVDVYNQCHTSFIKQPCPFAHELGIHALLPMKGTALRSQALLLRYTVPLIEITMCVRARGSHVDMEYPSWVSNPRVRSLPSVNCLQEAPTFRCVRSNLAYTCVHPGPTYYFRYNSDLRDPAFYRKHHRFAPPSQPRAAVDVSKTWDCPQIHRFTMGINHSHKQVILLG
jgi:hypothetical protein